MTEFVNSQLAQCPSVPELAIEHYGAVQFHDSSELEENIAAFICTGILNSLPFGKVRDKFFVKRLGPSQQNSFEQFGIAYGNYSEVVTLALSHRIWPSSLLTFLSFQELSEFCELEELQESMRGEDLQDGGLLENLLEYLPTVNEHVNGDSNFQRSLLWGKMAALSGDSFASMLSFLWNPTSINDWKSYAESAGKSVAPWITNRIRYRIAEQNSELLLLRELGTELLQSDDIFDATYIVNEAGPVVSNTKARATWRAARYLNTLPIMDRGGHPELLEAMLEQAEYYDGAQHVAVARNLFTADPNTAFVLICNASAYFSNMRRQMNPEYLELVLELAKSQGWSQLVRYYQILEKYAQ